MQDDTAPQSSQPPISQPEWQALVQDWLHKVVDSPATGVPVTAETAATASSPGATQPPTPTTTVAEPSEPAAAPPAPTPGMVFTPQATPSTSTPSTTPTPNSSIHPNSLDALGLVSEHPEAPAPDTKRD